jgi:hypothetical protein
MTIRPFDSIRLMAPGFSRRSKAIGMISCGSRKVVGSAEVTVSVNNSNLLKQTALALVIAAQCAGAAYAGGTDHKAPLAEEVKSEATLIAVSDLEKEKLARGQVVIGTADKPNGRRWVTAKIRIKANPSVVWDAVHEERKTDPDLAYSKVLEEGKNEFILEQKFQLIPVVGTSVCVIKSTEVPHKRIDYHLLKSDRFKAVEGSWILQPADDGTTILELGSYIDIGLPAPRTIVEGVAGRKLERRVANVRKVAELTQSSKVAHSRPDEPISN